LDIDKTSGLSIRFYNSGTFKAGIQAVTGAGQMVGTSAANDFGIRSQSNLLFASGGNTERMRIDSSGNVGIGTSTLNKIFNIADPAQGGEQIKLHFEASSGADKWAIYSYDRTNGHYTNLSFGANYLYLKSGGNVGIGETNPVAKLAIKGANDTNFEVQPDISSGVNRITNFNRVNSTYKKLRIDASEHEFYISGNPVASINSTGIVMPSGKGINFSATADTTASGATDTGEILTEYEEGTFTPTLVGATSTGSVNYILQQGSYTKIGRLVNFAITIYANSGGNNISGDLTITGLPFTATNATNAQYAAVTGWVQYLAFSAQISFYVGGASAVLIPRNITSGGSGTLPTGNDLGNSFYIIVSGTYNG